MPNPTVRASHPPGKSIDRPFAPIAHDMVANESLTSTDLRVWAALLFFARGGSRCDPTDVEIVARTGKLSIPTIQRSLRNLVRLDLVERQTTRGRRGTRVLILHREVRPESPTILISQPLTDDRLTDHPRSVDCSLVISQLIIGDQSPGLRRGEKEENLSLSPPLSPEPVGGESEGDETRERETKKAPLRGEKTPPTRETLVAERQRLADWLERARRSFKRDVGAKLHMEAEMVRLANLDAAIAAAYPVESSGSPQTRPLG